MNLKNIKNIKQGFKDLTPLQLSQARIAGYAGTTIGAGLAAVTMFIARSWGIGILLTGVTWLQIIALISEKKLCNNLVEIQKQINEVEEDGIRI